MKLEPLCEMDLAYQGGFALVKPYGGEEGTGYGTGDGTVSGGLTGNVRWANHPHRRTDGRMLPDAAGEIRTAEGELVMFRLTGRTVFREVNGTRKGGQLLSCLFETDAARLAWLNDALCVVEGVIDDKLRLRLKVFSCVHEGL
ncbi:MAG: hypothetical protein NVS1B1_01550 [Candidatus Limnocylindrales bacterium]